MGLTLVESVDEVDDFRRWLGERRPILGVDCETSGLSLAKDRIRMVQFGDAQRGWALPYADWRGIIRHVLESYKEPIVLQHAKFDAGFLQRDGLPFPWERAHDTMFMAFLVNSLGPKGLKGAAALYVDAKARSGESNLKRLMARNRWSYGSVPVTLPEYWGYAALDTVLTARLAETLWPRVQPYREAYDLELACERVLCDMELRGVRIDVPYCESVLNELRAESQELQEQIGDLNPNAPHDVAQRLVQEGASLTKRTATGKLAVDDEVLRGLAPTFKTAELVLRHRYNQKMRGSYFENFLEYRSGDLLHPHINQIAARTGRMSVTEPALQTIPRTAQVRGAFIPREGNILALLDYDNEELRVAAHFSGDENMISALTEGRDLHGELALRLYGEGYTKEQRGIAKAGMFAKAYGAGINKFTAAVGLSPEEGATLFRTIDATYPRLAEKMAQVSSAVRHRAADEGSELGWVKLIDGRCLKVPADKPYVGFNVIVQGSCAVVLKRALVDLDAADLAQYVVLPVHDEVVADVPREDAVEITRSIARVLTREDFRVPLTVGAKLVSNWGAAYE